MAVRCIEQQVAEVLRSRAKEPYEVNKTYHMMTNSEQCSQKSFPQAIQSNSNMPIV